MLSAYAAGELGVRLDLSPERVAQVAEEAGITFCFAQTFHPAYRHTGVPRKEVGVPTTFNFLGPLTNPARPSALAVGVADPRMGPVLAGVLAGRGNSALVFHGDDGLDELTTTGPSAVWVVTGGTVSQVASILAGDFSRRGLDPDLAPLYAQALVGSVSMTAQWWLDAREPKKEVVAAHLVNLVWNGLTHLEADPRLQDE